MEYAEVLFQGEYIRAEKERAQRDALITASFTAWQGLCTQVERPPTWGKYLKSIGLGDKRAGADTETLKREAAEAMDNVEKIKQRYVKARTPKGGHKCH